MAPDSNNQLTPAARPGPVQRAGYIEADAAYYNNQDQGDDPHGGLLEYWRILRRRKGTLILIAFAGIVLGVLVTLPQTPVYQARASLEIQDINNEVVNLRSQTSATEMGSNTNALADVQTQIKILQSESLVERSLSKVAKQPVKEAVSRPSAWRSALGLPEPPKPGPEQLVKSALNNLKARSAGQTRIVEITFDSPDPEYAAGFLNTLTNEFIEQNVDARWKMMQRTGDWLTRQIEDVKIKLERSEDALQNYARRSGLIFTGSGSGPGNDKQNITEEKLHQIQAELSKAQADRVAKQSRYEMARTAPPESLPDVLNDPSLRDYSTKLTDLRRQQAELSATYKPEYSKVKRIEAQIAPLEAAFARERQAILARIKNEYEETLRKEKLLSTDYSSQTRLVTGDAEKSIQYNILKREVDTNRQIYDSMLQRVKESSIASAMRASNIRIVDSARAPQRPYKPVTTTNAALGGLAGLFLGIAFVVMQERADRTLQQPGDSSFYLNLPELGVIPSANSLYRRPFYYLGRGHKDEHTEKTDRRKPKTLLGTITEQTASHTSGLPHANGASTTHAGSATNADFATNAESVAEPRPSGSVPPAPAPLTTAHAPNTPLCDRVELITYQRKPSMVAEAFRTVLTSLLFSGKNGSRPRVLVLTSASPAEGKTTVASNLAIALAEIKYQTLIIDADLRKPRMHDIFGLENDRGLSDVLQQRSQAAEALAGLIRETAVPGLYVLPAGPATSAAANLLYGKALEEVIAACKKQFEMVIIDTPPMLQMPDARVVARAADAVILVARAHQTTRDAAIAASARFAEDGTHLLGAILNDWDPKSAPNGYYGYYRNYGAFSKYSS